MIAFKIVYTACKMTSDKKLFKKDKILRIGSFI